MVCSKIQVCCPENICPPRQTSHDFLCRYILEARRSNAALLLLALTFETTGCTTTEHLRGEKGCREGGVSTLI
jgi:hypothetical protein